MNTKTIRSALVAIVAIGLTAPAFASDDTAKASIQVHGLDLANAADRGLVQQQIRAAARRLCSTADGGTVGQMQASRRCYKDAVRNGNAQLVALEMRRSTALAAR